MFLLVEVEIPIGMHSQMLLSNFKRQLHYHGVFCHCTFVCDFVDFVFVVFVVFILSLSQVHPCGRYRHNSVVFLLGKEYNLKNLHSKSVFHCLPP